MVVREWLKVDGGAVCFFSLLNFDNVSLVTRIVLQNTELPPGHISALTTDNAVHSICVDDLELDTISYN